VAPAPSQRPTPRVGVSCAGGLASPHTAANAWIANSAPRGAVGPPHEEQFQASGRRRVGCGSTLRQVAPTLTAPAAAETTCAGAIQALAAVLGGTQSLHTNAYDEALALPTEAERHAGAPDAADSGARDRIPETSIRPVAAGM